MAYNQIADIMRALGQNPTNKEVTKLLGNPSADGKTIKSVQDSNFSFVSGNIKCEDNCSLVCNDLAFKISTCMRYLGMI